MQFQHTILLNCTSCRTKYTDKNDSKILVLYVCFHALKGDNYSNVHELSDMHDSPPDLGHLKVSLFIQ